MAGFSPPDAVVLAVLQGHPCPQLSVLLKHIPSFFYHEHVYCLGFSFLGGFILFSYDNRNKTYHTSSSAALHSYSEFKTSGRQGKTIRSIIAYTKQILLFFPPFLQNAIRTELQIIHIHTIHRNRKKKVLKRELLNYSEAWLPCACTAQIHPNRDINPIYYTFKF